MCGIAGAVDLRSDKQIQALSEAVASMVAQMEHRGPDAKGVAPFATAVLGCCRLSILGLEPASNQPMRSPDSNCTVVYNGEIFNYVELRDQLRDLGHRFASTGDTEVILHAYEEWGLECLPHFNGMFAFAILDGDHQRLFFARDRFGIKPFCYAEERGLYLFASEPRALLTTGLVPRDPDLHTVEEFLRFGVTDVDDRTFFSHIKQLPPGHFGVIESGRIRVSAWYSLAEAAASPNSPERGRIAEFRKRLERSIALRFRSDVPVGILLSGGIDSSTIATLGASQPHDDTQRAFTVTFPGSRVDERPYAEEVAARSGLSLTTRAAPEMDLRWAESCHEDQGEPFISPSIVAQWLMMRTVHESGIRVLLTGQGADEYLGGYQYFESYAIADLLARRKFSKALSYLFDERNAPRLATVVAQVSFLFLPAGFQQLLWRKPWLRSRRDSRTRSAYEEDLVRCRSLRDALLFHVKRRLPELLRYEDRNSMAFSIETRHPFLDHGLVELVLDSPPGLIVGANARKNILRLAVQEDLPPNVLRRRDKVGFDVPDAWLQSEAFRNAFNGLCSRIPSTLADLLDIRRARKLLRRRSRRARRDLWRIYSVLLWHEQLVRPHAERGRVASPTFGDFTESAMEPQLTKQEG